jgi:GT2 family glycosyltransferase
MVSNQEAPKIAVIIVNWNGKHFLDTCLSSLVKQTYKNYYVIVVDNGSTDGSCEFIENAYPQIRLIKLSENTGFAKGNNIGIREAFKDKDIKYIALLNNDAKVDMRWLHEMVKAAEENETIGMCSCKIFLGETTIIQNIANYITRDGSGGSLLFGKKDTNHYSHNREVFCPCGAAALYKREMLEHVGLFDEDFFSYFEDLDLGWRGRLNGWKCMHVANAIVHHYHSKTYGAASPMKAYYIERNRIWFVIKNFPMRHLLASVPYSIMRYFSLAKNAWKGVDSAGKLAQDTSALNLVTITLKAYRDALVKAAKMIVKRGKVRNLQKVSNEEISLWFKKFGNL